MKRFLFLLVCLLVGANTLVHAQLSTKENPISFSFSIDSLKSIDYRIMPALDMKKIEAEDLVDEQCSQGDSPSVSIKFAETIDYQY